MSNQWLWITLASLLVGLLVLASVFLGLLWGSRLAAGKALIEPKHSIIAERAGRAKSL